MISPTINNLRTSSLLPKILFAIFAIAILTQISSYSSFGKADRTSTTTGGESKAAWFQDAIKGDSGDRSLAVEDNVAAGSSPLNFDKTFISYGATKCLPPFDNKMKQLAIERNPVVYKVRSIPGRRNAPRRIRNHHHRKTRQSIQPSHPIADDEQRCSRNVNTRAMRAALRWSLE